MRLRDQPLRRRLSLVILLVACAAMVAAFLTFWAYERGDLRRTMIRDLTVLADVLARGSRAALVFEDPAAAESTLATLEVEPYVLAAGLYDAKGELFAAYSRPDAGLGPPKSPPVGVGESFANGGLTLVRPVELDDRRVGTILLRSDLSFLSGRLRRLAGVAVVSLAGALALALLLSVRLRDSVTAPILELAGTAKRIGEEADYGLRAEAGGSDEVAGLARAFNAVLDGLEQRESALLAEVRDRRAAEGKVRAQLANLELLDRLTRSIGERMDATSIFGIVVASLEEDLPVDFAAACLYDPGSASLTVAGMGNRARQSSGRTGVEPEGEIPLGTNGLVRCVAGELVHEADTARSRAAFPTRLAAAGLRSLVVAPLQVESDTMGVLMVARRDPGAFSSDECQFLRQLGEHVALAIHQARLHGALQRAYDDLRMTQQTVMQQERLRALGEMASGIAHDINNAISPISLYTEMLLEDEPGLSDRAREFLEIGQRAIDDIAETVARLKEFYRQREPEMRMLPVRLNPLIGQVIKLTRARWSAIPLQRGVVVEMEEALDPVDPAVTGVESELREALTNLVFNAVDAMPDGGRIRLVTRLEKGSGSAAAERAVIEVTDTGVGMDEDTRRRCLEPFFTTKGDRGTGLGLAMVYGTVQRHGGDIEVDSAPGVGTTFRLLLPVPVVRSAVAREAGAVSAPIGRLRILAVDDDPLVLRAVSRTLEAAGHAVTAAASGAEGVASFQAAQERGEPFEIVITDLGMPHVDGKRVASAVKAASPSTPVILLTGWGKRLEAAGESVPNVDRILGKPPKLAELQAAIADCLEASRGADSPGA